MTTRVLVDYTVPKNTEKFLKDLRKLLDKHGAQGTFLFGRIDCPEPYEVIDFFYEKNHFTYDPLDFFEYYEASCWTHPDGCPINWRQMMVSWEARNKTKMKVKCYDC